MKCQSPCSRCIFFRYSHKIRPVSVNQGTKGQAALPRHGEVCHINIPVALCLPLAPVEQLTGPSYGFWCVGKKRKLNAWCEICRWNSIWSKQGRKHKLFLGSTTCTLAEQSHSLGSGKAEQQWGPMIHARISVWMSQWRNITKHEM